MSHPNEFTVSQAAIIQARACGFYTHAEARLRGIAAKAVPSYSPSGNATYGPYVLLLQGRHVLAITLIGPHPVDDRPVSACQLCGGMMTRPKQMMIEGKEGVAYRPCPRAFDASQPLCDTLEKTK